MILLARDQPEKAPFGRRRGQQARRPAMRLTVDGIGKVTDTEVRFDGITVIAGPNNSGKSTIGKTLFALVNSQYDFTTHVLTEKEGKIETLLYRYLSAQESISMSQIDLVINLTATGLVRDLSGMRNNDSAAVSRWFKNAEERFDGGDRTPDPETVESIRHVLHGMGYGKGAAYEMRVKCAEILNDGAPLYRTRFMEEEFRELFAGQVNRVQDPESTGTAVLAREHDEGSIEAEFRNDECVRAVNTLGSQYCVLLIEDPRMIGTVFAAGNRRRGIPSFLRYAMSKRDPDDMYEQQKSIIRKRLDDARQGLSDTSLVERRREGSKIVSVLERAHAGSVDFDENGTLVLSEGSDPTGKVNLENASMGVKAVEFIKKMLRQNVLDEDTFLVLDEPEIHLHPEWQIIYAKALVMIARRLHTRILVTTHSPYFLQALQVYAEAAHAGETFNVYTVEEHEGACRFQQADELDLDDIIDSMSRPFDELMKVQAAGDEDLTGEDR